MNPIKMSTLKSFAITLTLLALAGMLGCNDDAAKSPDVSDNIRKSLDQAGLKDVSVSQDRDKGIVTLGGQVATANAKFQAESLAKSFAGAQVVADQIAVIPVGAEKAAKAVNSDLDQAIEKKSGRSVDPEQTPRPRHLHRKERSRYADRRSRLGKHPHPRRKRSGRRAECAASSKRFTSKRSESQFLVG
jgi:hypothetical protein